LSPPHRNWLTVEGRPLINLSLAINYALGGYNVWGYHALNLTVHILAGLTLLGIVRRTLLQPPLRERFGTAADELALATAVLWTVHPLQTESVTYIIQRAESIMGLFYLLTLYCFIRGVESPTPRLWYGLSVAACALGMASKEVMVSAPLMVLLYDRAFLSESFREAWRRRRPVYLALASTWIVLGVVLLSAGILTYASMTARRIDRWQYLATQPGVILSYLRLSVWPSPLILARPWPFATTWMSILPSTVVVVIVLMASAWVWRRNRVWGFAGAWFFLILAPSSSFIPLPDPMYEHRMYLPLAIVICLVVTGLYALLGRRSWVLFALMAIGLGAFTWRRNQDYRTELGIWQDALAKCPNNPRAHDAVGVILWRAGRVPEAMEHWEQSLRIAPDYAPAQRNLGIALGRAGRIQEAIKYLEQAVRVRPDDVEAHYNLGVMLAHLGRIPEAMEHWEQLLRLDPDDADAHYNLGVALEQAGRVQQAIGHYEQALRLKPDLAAAQNGLARLRAAQ
jgi:tetratricopeptide (TPR) repeat protein